MDIVCVKFAVQNHIPLKVNNNYNVTFPGNKSQCWYLTAKPALFIVNLFMFVRICGFNGIVLDQ